MLTKILHILAVSAAITILSGRSFAKAAGPPVLAFYYAWFDENTWTSGQAAGTPATPYRSADPATIERHVSQAKAAGLDAFVQSWYGPQTTHNQTETNFQMLLDTAARYQFQAAVDVEVMGPFFSDAASVQAGLASLTATHINHPAYLRFQGKPVIFFWRQQRFSVDEWRAIRQAVDPNHSAYWIAEGLGLNYLDAFDGIYLYSIAWAANPQAELGKWPPRIKQVETDLGVDKLWIATAMPGYNDLNLQRPSSFVRGRENGDYYRQTWTAAQASNPDMLIITSFNEWLEGTQIEPSAAYGDFYLNLTRELIQSTPPSAAAIAPTATPSPQQPTAQLTADPFDKLRAGPFDKLRADPFDKPVLSVAEVLRAGPFDKPVLSVAEVLRAGRQPFDFAQDKPPTTDNADSYIVQPGDTLGGIAQKLDISLQTLIALNRLQNPDRLKPGQVLILITRPTTSTKKPFYRPNARHWLFVIEE